MTPILDGADAILVELAARRSLLAFDFDGTLAPIVDDPAQAAPRPATRRLLGELTRLYPCALLSGRSRADVAARVADLPFRGIVGDHGAEQAAAGADGDPAAWADALARAAIPGVRVERTDRSVAAHYRGAADPEAARRAILRVAEALPGARVFGGKLVVNITPAGAPTKADALCAVWEEVGAELVLYVGDDETDEDVFASGSPALITIRVGRDERSAARFYLREQVEVDALLARLVELRRGPRRVTRPRARARPR